MARRSVLAIPSLVLGLVLSVTARGAAAAPSDAPVVQEDRVIAGGPKQSLEVRHLVLRGTNEQIGHALAEIAKARYGARLEPPPDPGQARAMRQFLQRNYPILLDRMRGVAAAFGKSIDDDALDFSTLIFTELKAACSIAHLPPSSTANGKSVVSRDYDFTTGNLSFRFLTPGMLHPTARPYLLELHPDRGYASIAMVAYDLLSGVLDGMNSEGLTVTMAQDNDILEEMEPTHEPAVGLGELQTMRLLLDTCANVEEAKQTLMATKQYYQFVPVHYLIADRHGDAFVWEYSKSHNKEYVVESPGEPLVMTNFTLHTRLENGKPPSPEAARPVCKRYAYLREKLAAGNLDDKTVREFHRSVDAQSSQAADPSRPPGRTFWHAFYYPEDRRVRLSYYLGEEPYPGEPRLIKQIRSDYVEFRLEPTQRESSASPNAATPSTTAKAVASAPAAKSTEPKSPAVASAAPSGSTSASKSPSSPSRSDSSDPKAAIEAVGGTVDRSGGRIVGVNLSKATSVAPVIPLLPQLRDLESLTMGVPSLTDADVRALQGLPKLKSVGLMGAPIGDESLEVMKSLPALRELNVIGTKVTDAGLAHLEGLTQLEYLGLKGTAVTDAGLEHLRGLTGLTNLNLADTKVSDAGLVHLVGMPRLESVNLSNTNVTDAGLATLARNPSVAGINVSGTRVTDAGLVNLKPLPKLTKLNVSGTAVTPEGVKDAKKFLPFWATVTR
jgi:penicillin V acylase-like amidase (Ntn superfamily)